MQISGIIVKKEKKNDITYNMFDVKNKSVLVKYDISRENDILKYWLVLKLFKTI